MIRRHLPLGLAARAAVFTVSGLIGCLLLLQGQVVAWFILPRSDVAYLLSSGPVERGGGMVTDVHGIRAFINKQQVMAVEFAYQGGSRRGTSYGTRVTQRPGENVEVEWPAGRPEAARIVGLSRRPVPPWALIPTLLPGVVGLGFALFALRVGRRRVRLLERGRTAPGRVVALEKTRTRVNKRPVFRVRFSYPRQDGRIAETVVRTHRTEKLTVGAEALLVHDPDGDAALIVEQISGAPRLTDSAVEGTGGVLGIVALLLPVAAVAGWIPLIWLTLR